MRCQVRLRYGNIVIGNLIDIERDMYRERGKLELIAKEERQLSVLSVQLFKWIEISSKLGELDLILDNKAYNESTEVEKLWNQYSRFPSFEIHEDWNLFNEESGKMDSISSPYFYLGSVSWTLIPKPVKTKDRKGAKDYAVGILIGLVLVILWFLFKYGSRIQ